MTYDYLNVGRKSLLELIQNEFANEISSNKVLINEIAIIPTDYDDDEKVVFYVEKSTGSFTDPYLPDSNYYKGTFTIGVRSTTPEKEQNVQVTEDYIYRLWAYLNNNEYYCGYLVNLTSEPYLLTKDRINRYFWQFTVEITNR